jgi:holo-[acyl-carrier protein] synthase
MTDSPAPDTATAGPVVLHGVDAVSIDRIEALLAEFPETFPERICSPAERRYCDGRGYPAQHYAARWAATEAVRKLLDGATTPIAATDVAIDRHSDGPRLALAPSATAAIEGTLERQNGGVVPEWDAAVSLSHDRDLGVAIGSVTVAASSAGIEP